MSVMHYELYRAAEVDRMQQAHAQEVADLKRRLASAMHTIATLTANGAHRGGPSAREAELEREVERLRAELDQARRAQTELAQQVVARIRPAAPTRAGRRPPRTTTCSCGSPLDQYQDGCWSCATRKRAHERRGSRSAS